jgi:crotonobetainyl-CoA:carnitine CoA-transferase CaiB-like acyl-CoA transferase
VFVESSRDSCNDDKGIGPSTLRRLNPNLVLTSIAQFDRYSRFAQWDASEINLFAMSGLMSTVGGVGRPPLKAGGYQAQYMAGLQACAFTLFGLYGSQARGTGSWIDTSTVEMGAKIMEHFRDRGAEEDGALPPDERRERANGVLPCGEGFVTVTLYYFLMGAIGELLQDPTISDDPRFSSEPAVNENQEAIRSKLVERFKTMSADEAQMEGQRRRLLITKVHSMRDLIESPHFNARGAFVHADHPTMGQARFPGPPFRLSLSSPPSPKPAPILGEANEYVLCERLGYSRSDLGRLREARAI